MKKKQNNHHTNAKLQWNIRALCHKLNHVSILSLKGKNNHNHKIIPVTAYRGGV